MFIITQVLQVIFTFMVQVSNSSPNSPSFNVSLNSFFSVITLFTMICGVYLIIYDYKTDKLIVYNCNKGKFFYNLGKMAIFYMLIYFFFIIILGSIYESSSAVYIVTAYSLAPIVLILYQVPY